MYTRDLYLLELIPKYNRMLELLDSEPLKPKSSRLACIDVCNSLNNFIDFFAAECRTYTKNEWNSNNANDLRIALEKRKHTIDGFRIEDEFFGYVRDIANCSKHIVISRPDAKIRHTNQLYETLGIIKYTDDRGEYYGFKTLVVVDDENAQVPVEAYAYLALRVVTDMLIDAEVIPNNPKNGIRLRQLHLTRLQCESLGNPKVEVPVKENFAFPMKPYIFDEIPFLQIRRRKAQDRFNCTFTMDVIATEELF